MPTIAISQMGADALQKCRDAGIKVIMVTGDHPHTAAQRDGFSLGVPGDLNEVPMCAF